MHPYRKSNSTQLQTWKFKIQTGEYADGTPVERLALSWDHRAAASASHEAAVRLWDLSCLHDDDDGDDDDDEEGEGGDGGEVPDAAALAAGKAAAGGGSGDHDGSGSGGSGSGDEDSDGGSDSDSDGDGGKKRKRRRRERTRMTKGNNKPKKGGNFFADLL